MKYFKRLCTILAAISLLSIYTYADMDYQECEHTLTEFYPKTFSAQVLYTSYYSLYIQSSIFNDRLGVSIQEDLEQTVESFIGFLGIEPPSFEIYVVKEPANGTMQVIDNRLYCTPQDINKRVYIRYLASAMTQCEYWKSAGLYRMYLQKDVDTELLADFYTESADIDVLSLSPLWFNTSLTSEEERGLAEATAQSLSAFLIDRDGMEAFLAEDYADSDRTEWLRSIGVEKEYRDVYPNLNDQYIFIPSSRYAAVALSKTYNMIFNLKAIAGQSDSPTLVRRFLNEADLIIGEELDWIAREAPVYYERCYNSLQLGSRINVNLDGSRSTVRLNNIFLARDISFACELMFAMVPLKSFEYNTPYWAFLGLSSDAQMRFATDYVDDYYRSLMRYALSTYDAFDGDQAEYIREVLYYCADKFDKSGTIESASTKEIIELMALCELKLNHNAPIRDYHPVVRKDMGNELTDYQIASFVDYLINIYSPEKMLKFCFSQPVGFDEVFGIPYEEAKSNWISYLQNKYGEMF